MNHHAGMTVIVKTVTRVMVWMMLLYGMYLILHGHLTPGGGFGGGVIIALAFLSIFLAYGRAYTEKWLKIEALHHAESAAILLFLLVGLLGLITGGAFFANFLSHGTLFSLASAGTIPVLNILIGIKVGVSLFLAVWVLSDPELLEGGDI